MVSCMSYTGDPAWLLRILRQEGILVRNLSGLAKAEIKAAAIHADFESLDSIGGATDKDAGPRALFTSHAALAKELGIPCVRRQARYFSFSHPGQISVSDLRVFSCSGLTQKGFSEYGQHLRSNKKALLGTGIYVGSLNGRLVISVPWDFTRTPESSSAFSRYMQKTFSSGDQILELSTGIDSAPIRQAIFFMVKLAHKTTQTTLSRISPVPIGAPYSIVRIDADGYSEASTKLVEKVSENLDIPFSWYIDGYSWRHQILAIRRIARKSEIGVHCYFHLTFHSRRSNLKNFLLANQLLGGYLGKVSGAVSPHGTWTRGYSAAVSRVGFNYTSEFAVSEPDLPFFPSTRDSLQTLQIPTPPHSIGSWSGRGSYWDFAAIDLLRQETQRGVGIVYDHPLGRLENNIEGFESFLADSKRRGAKFITMSEWAVMWLERESHLDELTNLLNRGVQPHVVSSAARESNISFAYEEINLSSFLASIQSFGSLLQSRQELESAEWRLGKSLKMLLLGLVPIEAHLAWQSVRARMIKVAQ